MQKRELGKSGITVAPITFGGNVFGWTIDEKKSFEILDAFTAAGFDFIDTADVYSHWVPGNHGGESETIIGNWVKLRGNRDKIIIATKVGAGNNNHGRNLTKKYILQTVEESLKRLQTDYIDLYQTHWDDDVTPVEETLDAYSVLIKAGKVRAIGASNLSPQRLYASLEARKKFGLPRYETFQPLYNLYDREPFEKELEAITVANNISVINYYSLASGFLTGKYRNEKDTQTVASARAQGVKKYLNARGLSILHALDKVSEKYNAELATVALAWLLARPSVTAPIASATNTHQLSALVKAVDLILTKDDIAVLNEASAW